MKLLLLGKDGQVGWELQRALQPLGEVVALGRGGNEMHCGDLGNAMGLRQTVRSLKPDVIVNAAAYNAVDKAEEEPELARLINAVAPAILAEESARLGSVLIHYSTDYVFDGSGDHPWSEADQARPLSTYGHSKREGEAAILESGCRHLIFRTSWVYGGHGQNFIKTMLRLGRKRDVLNVIDDQIGVPTGAELLADVTSLALRSMLLNSSLGGLYHLVPAGETSWYGYARFIFEQASELGETLKLKTLNPIPTAGYPLPAARPKNSRLSTEKLREAFALQLPQWQLGVTRMLTEWLGNNVAG